MSDLPLLTRLTHAADRTAACACLRRQRVVRDALHRESRRPDYRSLVRELTMPAAGRAEMPGIVPGASLRDLTDGGVDAGPEPGQGSVPEPQKLHCCRKRNAAIVRPHASIVRGAHEHVRGCRESGRLKSCAPDLRRVSDPRTACGLRNRPPFGNLNRKDPTMSHGDSGRASARLAAIPASTSSAGAIHHSSYPRCALAYVAAGSLPPLPVPQDFGALTAPAVAALLSFPAGGTCDDSRGMQGTDAPLGSDLGADRASGMKHRLRSGSIRYVLHNRLDRTPARGASEMTPATFSPLIEPSVPARLPAPQDAGQVLARLCHGLPERLFPKAPASVAGEIEGALIKTRNNCGETLRLADAVRVAACQEWQRPHASPCFAGGPA
jgi:hypothetical protein